MEVRKPQSYFHNLKVSPEFRKNINQKSKHEKEKSKNGKELHFQ
nr:MAG TPA: hypothetical protein [Caudoviricetes sp.]